MLKNRKTRIFALSLLLAIFLLAGCAGIARTPEATATPAATPVPPTPTPAPDEILYVNSQSAADDSLLQVLNDFASANSLQVRSLPALTAADLTPSTRIAVLATLPEDWSNIASGAPDTQFVLLGVANGSNLSNVSSIQAKPEDEAFMAGYLTTLIAIDWRAGALVPNDGPLGTDYAEDFMNGGQFVCGKCNPQYSPITAFPTVSSEPTASSTDTWSNDALTMSQYWMSSLFVDPAAASADVVTAINTRTVNAAGVYMVSTSAAPNDGSISWTALLGVDYASSLQILLPQLLAGQGNQNAGATITLASFNPDVVSTAKQELFKQVATSLAAGDIIPYTVK
jgi:hypothetical protein